MSLLKGQMLVRSLSTSSAAAQLVKPPVQVFGLEGRYAAALYSAATKNKTLDTVEKELSQFQQSIKGDPKLKEYLYNPSIKRSLKADGLKAVSAQVRSLSTSSAAAQLVKPPVQVFGLEGRYAAALYSAATKNKTLDTVEKELSQFQQSIKGDPKLKEYLYNPSIKRSLKADGLKAVSAQINMSPTTGNLLCLLAENGRLSKLETVINAFKIIMAAHRGEVTCEVITAKPLDQAQRQNLEAALKKFLKSNEKLQLTAKVDPALIGGMVVSIADKYVDMSVASKVKKYTELISATV